LQAQYIDTGKVRLVFREVYFDRPGLWASMVARCGGEMRFHGLTELMFERQGEWARAESGPAIIEQLRTIGKTAGLTDEQLDECTQDANMAQSLVTWSEELREANGVTATPTLFVDGVKYSNMSFADLAAIIEERLAAQ
jgi:protein-disulfide isomerase